MQKSDKTLLKATGWIFLVWGFATIFLDVLFLMLKNVPADALWVQTLAGNLDMMAISVVMGCLEECDPYSGPVPGREPTGKVVLTSAMGKTAQLQILHGGNR